MGKPVDVGGGLIRHSLESSATAVAGIVVLAAILPRSVPFWTLPVCGGALTVTVMVTAMLATGSAAVTAYLTAWGITLTGWLATARLEGLWHADIIAAIVLPGIILAPLGAVAIGHHRAALAREAADAENRNGGRELRYWQDLLGRAGVPGVTILDIIRHGSGLQVHGRLGQVTADGPLPGTEDSLRNAIKYIAQHRRLPAGAVSIEQPRGTSSADFILHIRENVGTRPVTYLPAENHPLTINRPLPLAVRDDNREWALRLREVNVLIAGVTGSGKSNLASVFIAQLARCVDVVIFMIDLKGGRAARPWMLPWIQGFAKRPVIDWLATTREEAALMLKALWDAREDRSRSGAGGEKVTPDAELPAIILICDESAVLTGHGIKEDGISNYSMARYGARLAETGRSEAINIVMAAVRADVETMGNTAIKAMSRVRIGMAVTSEADGRSIFPDDAGAAAALSKITEPGSGIAKVIRDVSPPLHFYRVTDGEPDPDTGKPTEDRITPVATVTGDLIRPALDERTAAAMGDAYATRWDRPHGQALKDEWGVSVRKARPDLPGEFGQIVAHLPDPEADVSVIHRRAREILRDRRYQGATVRDLRRRLSAEGLTVPRETLSRWLAADSKLGLARSTGSPHHRWTWVRHDDDQELGGTG